MTPTRRQWAIGAGIAILAVAGLIWLVRRPASGGGPVVMRQWTPLPKRVTVEVLNSGKVAGAGRAGTLLLRRAGLDVVYFGNADAKLADRDRNQVLIRGDDTSGVGRVVEALGDAEVIEAPDRTRLVDLTVLLGKKFAVPVGH